MNILDLIVYVAVGFVGGGCMGYALGATSTRRCVECLRNDINRYQTGHKAGYRDGTVDAVKRVRSLGTEARNTYTITKSELERIEAEAESL